MLRILHHYIVAETALKFLEMVQLGYANQENKDDDDLPIHYQVFFFFKGTGCG